MSPFNAIRRQPLGGALGAVLLWLGSLFGTPAWAINGTAVPTALLRVEMRPQAQVQQAQVQLGDIAILSSPDLALLRRAMALPLGQAPRIGDTAVLELDRLALWLRSRTGLREDQVQWQGSTSTVLTVAARELPGEEVVDKAQSALRDHLMAGVAQKGWIEPRIEMQAVSVPSTTLIPLGGSSLRVRPLGNVPVGKRMLVWVDVLVHGQHVKTIPVRFEVSLFTLAPVAANDMAVGTSVQADNLVMREVDAARLGDVGPSALGQPAILGGGDAVAAQRVRRNLHSGDVVTPAHLQPVPAVSRGEWVSLVSRSGLVSLESRVEVLQDGQVGQVVRARPLNATGVLLARVTAPGHLELQP
ncbi:flagellar basal body P-ring formation chaperone FlgA [Acidovorax sp. SUPP2539]|uniref:flagellar basal body P-ring formation chaperone FlgA n=1 Tax=Acidovorax sp. SUPP2539 TaxID=2920878 RepID=UPI0023DE3845|nr:flagellar basal body P-ring formation chaperone FlgA [Acidovorax sp. SUPP2539]GKS88066.1 flagellar basal body P-ring formation chaperone FlgA [Acidovorax sp. SUPP2539]